MQEYQNMNQHQVAYAYSVLTHAWDYLYDKPRTEVADAAFVLLEAKLTEVCEAYTWAQVY
jgi:hypothetical protein